jgi:hypothetical protein
MRRIMKSKQQSPIWPYLGILAFLFVLSLTAPRGWDRQSRQQTDWLVAQSPSVETQVPVESVVTVESCEQIQRDLHESEAELAQAVETPPPDKSPSDDEIVPPAPEFADEVRDPVDLANRPAAPVPAPAIEPPVDKPPVEPDDAAAALATSAWPLPRVLLEQLTSLMQEDRQLVWPERAIGLVHELCQSDTDYAATKNILEQLRDLATHDASLPPVDSSMAAGITRARYALVRWVDIWSAAAALRELPIAERAGRPSPERIGVCLAEFDALPRNETAKDAWREYLMLEALKESARRQSDEDRRAAARAVLDRLGSRRLSRAQRRFVDDGPLADLKKELRVWAAEPVTAERLLAHLEEYEYTRLPSDAWQVANDLRGLHWSAPEEADRLSQQLHTHYQNANVRVAIAGSLLDRMIPQPGRIDAPVRDSVVNVPVRGSSSTFTKLSVQLIPDTRRIRLGLEARGIVASNTISTSGPATFRNQGQSTFLVRKLFVLGPQGLSIFPAIAEAENNYNYLVSLETNFDSVPLVGSLVQTIARNQHDEVRDQARFQTAEKVAIRALHQLDSEAEARVSEAARKIENQQIATLRRLGLELTPISLSTTQKRIVARARLASPQQLGAHTPRPRAPSDSWFSLQVHQSAFNNALEQLDLNGRTFEISELFAWVAKKLDRPNLAELDELPDDVQVTFAKKDAVQINCQDGRVEVTFALAELSHGRDHWQDFQVHTTYMPQADGLVPRFVRDDTIHLDGRSVRGRLEFKLRAIFSKVLSKKRDLRLLGESITGDARLEDLHITQFAVEDGWIALAYGPRGEASKVARQGE